MGTGPASPQAQACGPSEPAADSSFSFTPIKALRAIPHLWERKPSTPFQAGAKSRKLWKRFRTSFSSMKSLETSTMMEQGAIQTAINASRDASYARGVKRLCVGADEPEKRPNFQIQGPARSFLETKWESERGQKRRKLPDAPIDIYDEGVQNNRSDGVMTESDRPLISLRSPLKTTVFNDYMNQSVNGASDANEVKGPGSGSMFREQCAIINTAAQDENRDMAPTPTKVVRDLTQQQEGTLVRSALHSSLDGSDTALLNDFLSKAQAKRAAKAALMDQEGDVAEKVSSAEGSPEAEITTPRSRRALEALDTNSPSPVKPDVTITKSDVPLGDEAPENEVSKLIMEEEPAPGSPSCRRSTRVKAPTVNVPNVRNTIALRRAKGNEFIFLQRTEAQELALATKKNTRLNRGDAVPPPYVLEALAKGQSEGTSPTKRYRKGASHRSSTQKSVAWNDEQLVEYEDDRQSPEVLGGKGNSSSDDVEESTRSRSASTRPERKASSQRSSRSQVQESSNNEESDSAPTPATAPTTAPPRSRRVRRLGDSTMASGTPVKTGSGRISKRPAPSAPTVAAAASAGPSTPTKPRRKLTPKSPSSSMRTAPASEFAGAAEQSFVSGIPTRSASTSDGSSESKRSVLQSSAGCTPRRVRVRH
ncbi:hypothetical protein N7486_008981 [Penicillium sp. IBT 16267x]|nr:hypothetical protein N7486_008981 [Penicillium sp. IBT 16267x]